MKFEFQDRGATARRRRHTVFLFLSVIFVGAPASVRADVGFDFLGIKIAGGWDCDSMLTPLSTLPRAIPVGWLNDTTFGTNTACLDRLLGSGKVNKARAHLLNNTCVRNKNCWSGELLNGYTLQKMQEEALVSGSPLRHLVCEEAKKVDRYAVQFPNIRFRISALLEHNLTRDAAIAIAGEVRSCAPHADPVDNPVNNPLTLYPPITEGIRELHGAVSSPISSLDGDSVENVDVESWKSANSTADMTLLWGLPYNCRLAKGWVQPNLRKNCPTKDQFSLFTRIWYPQQPLPQEKPPSCPSIEKLRSPWFYKTEAEDSGSAAPQANRPLIISPTEAEKINILAVNGSNLGWLKNMSDGRKGAFRYSLGMGSGQSAFQLGQSAELATGTEWIAVQGLSSCYWLNSYRTGPVTFGGRRH